MQYRKFTRIKNYDYNTNGYYFVTICTAARKPWLEIYKTAVETILKDIPKRFTGINIDFYSIMPDHLHVIFTLNNANAALGETVRTFKALVTKSTGRKPFWEWNYYEHIIRDENALCNIRKYILENPLKEKINWEKIYSGINAAATNETKHSPNNPQPCSADKGVQQIPPNRSGAIYRTNKGISLIIAVFAIMLFSVLGWTLVKIQSTDFESNVSTGNLNSERALNLAEAGAEWALQRLNLNGGFRTDTTNGYPLGYAQHSISPGQYRVSCLDGTGDDYGLAIITSNGYVPSASSYNTTRQVRLKIQVGSLTKAVMAQVADPDNQNVGLFDWSQANAGHTVNINGDISAGHYSGDGDANPDEANQDYGTAPMLPPGAAGSKRDFTAAYPAIDMEWFHDNADEIWPNRDVAFPVSSTIANNGIGFDNTPTPTSCIAVNDSNFFTGMNDQAIRLTAADLSIPDNQDGWRRIYGLGNGGGINCCTGFPNDRCARVRLPVGPSWTDGSSVTLMVRFGSGADNGSPGDILYIGRQLDGGQSIETILDVNSNDLSLDNRYIISEGSIFIKGTNGLTMNLTGSVAATRYPRLATQNGGIVSPDAPSGATEAAKAGQRVISGLIYSELGEIKLHYLRPPNGGTAAYRGNLVYGEQVTLDGRIIINYLPGLVSTNGFTFAPATKTWDEE